MGLPHIFSWALCAAALIVVSVLSAQGADNPGQDGLLFSLSGVHDLNAEYAHGASNPNFAGGADIAQDTSGRFLKVGDKVTLAWHAAGNIYGERGTLAFNWRARTPLGITPFPVFRVGFADHSSWDMVWLRIDWNGHGFDAFVTDTSLARVRVSWKMDKVPPPDAWMHIAFGWDEAKGICLYVNGKLAAKKNQSADLDTGLDQFGPAARTISPMQVQSNFQFERGSDFKNLKIFDHMLKAETIFALAQGGALPPDQKPARVHFVSHWRQEWLHRYGWDRRMPVELKNTNTIIRKVMFKTAIDVKERMIAGNDGIDETTWPGVYNRSRLPGRHDYFELPDWNVYAEGGKSVRFVLPDETFNHIEFLGAAYGKISWQEKGKTVVPLAMRPQGLLRSAYDFSAHLGGALLFTNKVQETPIREFQAYNIHPGTAQAGEMTLSYRVRPAVDPKNYVAADEVRSFVRGRYPANEATLSIALPKNAPVVSRPVPVAALPVVHIAIPSSMEQHYAARPTRYRYGWNEMRRGLDGVVLHIPALHVKPVKHGLYPLNIQIKDPIWPERNLLDVSVSVKPDQAYSIFLDTRDRFLPKDSALYISLAGGGPGLDAAALSGMKIDLEFKPRAVAMAEHVADRLAEIRDNAAFIVEEYTGDLRFARARRLDREFKSLFNADPDNLVGRQYYAKFHPVQLWPKISALPPAPKGVPRWAFLQTEDLKQVSHFVNWWIDHRQSAYGDFGGGISDDDDLTHQWPPLAMMGVMPDKIRASLSALADAVDKNNMITNGLGTIVTDYLHTYEEGINARSDDLYLNWGSPKVLERLMQTARAYPRIVQKTADGGTHIISQLYSGTHVVTEGNMGWTHPYSYLILHPAYDLAGYNGDPAMVSMITDLADSYIKKGHRDGAGHLVLPEFVNGHTGSVQGRLMPHGRGLSGAVNLFLAAQRFTGNDKYFEPLKDLADQQPYPVLSLINSEVAVTGQDWLDRLTKDAVAATSENPMDRFYESTRGNHQTEVNFDDFYAWRKSGHVTWLERLYRHEISYDRQVMDMMTAGEWWSDRVEIPSDLLQRARLGGMALKRNQEIPGQLVSWRFGHAGDATQLGILIAHPHADHFTVVAYNLSDHKISAEMTGWNVAPGTWQISGEGAPQKVAFETSVSVPLTFLPHKTARFAFKRIHAGDDPRLRPDVGLDKGDVSVRDGRVSVMVHSLGAKTTPAGTIQLLNAEGKEIATAQIPPLTAPLDNRPETVTVGLKTSGRVACVVLHLPVHEVTMHNNRVCVH